MKRLRRHWVLGGLAIAALAGAVHWWWPAHDHSPARAERHQSPAPKGKPAKTAPGTLPAQTASADEVLPDTPVDPATAESTFLRLAEAPGRDPFQSVQPMALAPTPSSPVTQLKLRAIWRQPQRGAVVINGRVLLEGETIGGFTIERIEADRVWLRGFEKTEQLLFERGERPPPPSPRKGASPVRPVFGPPVAASTQPKT